MSPRSAELLAGAREALTGARAARDANAPARAVSAAYYAMLYAARAALSEEEANAKTHRGTWHLFHERFVATGRFEKTLYAESQRAQDLRELGDYSAQPPSAGRRPPSSVSVSDSWTLWTRCSASSRARHGRALWARGACPPPGSNVPMKL